MTRENDDRIEVTEENFGELLIQGLREARAVVRVGSPFDAEGIELGVTTEEIVDFVREGRRGAEPLRPTAG